MKLGRNGTELTSDPMTVAEFIQQFELLDNAMNAGLIDADNFDVTDSQFMSSYITNIADMPTVSKHFEGHFFDDGSASSAVELHTAYNNMLEKFGDEDILLSVDVSIIVRDFETSIKTSNSRSIISGIAHDVGDFFKDDVGGFIKDLSDVHKVREFFSETLGTRKGVEKMFSDIGEGITGFVESIFGKKKKKKKKLKYEVATSELILFDIPPGYEYVDKSVTGSISTELSSKRCAILFLEAVADDIVQLKPSIVSTATFGADESYVFVGNIVVRMRRKV